MPVLTLDVRQLAFLVVLLLAASAASAQSPSEPKTLTVKDVMRLVAAGVPEDIVVARIKRAAKPFDLTADEILELRKNGMPAAVIKYLIDPSLPYAPPPPPAAAPPPKISPPPAPAPAVPARHYPDDPLASKVPPEPGLYSQMGPKILGSALRTLVSAKSGGLGSKMSAGLVKGKIRAPLVGPKAKLRATSTNPTLYLRANSLKTDDLALVLLDKKDDRRELILVMEGKKPVVEIERMREFELTQVGSDLFRVTTARLNAGEFLLYLVGSADPEKGVFGKGFDFGIDAPPRK